MPKGTINGEPYVVPDGYEVVPEEGWHTAQAALSLLADLDRSPHGRHQGDVESQDPSGYSQGNPHLRPGQHIGYTISGARIVVPPDGGNLGCPSEWIEPR